MPTSWSAFSAHRSEMTWHCKLCAIEYADTVQVAHTRDLIRPAFFLLRLEMRNLSLTMPHLDATHVRCDLSSTFCCFGSGLFPLPGRSQFTTRHMVCFKSNSGYECWSSHELLSKSSRQSKKKKKKKNSLGLQIEIGLNLIFAVSTCEKRGWCVNVMCAAVFCS